MAWAPDGWKLAFVSLLDGSSEVYVMNPDGSAQQR
jgi:Tol biopolymer transport system component